MTRFQRICLVHYHEIGLKGHNRAAFENRLSENLRFLLEGFPVVTIRRISGRICVFLKEGTDYATAEDALALVGDDPNTRIVLIPFYGKGDAWHLPKLRAACSNPDRVADSHK